MNEIRSYWLDMMVKISGPVLKNMAKGTLKETLPNKEGKQSTHLEALGRTLCGIAYWLETPQTDEGEEKLRQEYTELARQAIAHAVNPDSPDYLPFILDERQPLVDAAFLAQALLRSPNELWAHLDTVTKTRLLTELKKTRTIKPYECNWLLFSAIIEAFFKFAGEDYLTEPVDYAIKKHLEWYAGDGVYGDGEFFHFDYYNSYVIQPMLIDVIKVFTEYDTETIWKRAKRYARIQERLINTDGTFPAIGRSITYRTGAFHLLSQLACLKQLPEELSEGMVKGALTAVLKKVFSGNNFDKDGWLVIGLYGAQPSLGESYISTGSLYLATFIFPVLGLPEADSFWTTESKPWTSVKIWNGVNVTRDKNND